MFLKDYKLRINRRLPGRFTMRKIDKFIDELQELKKKGYDKKKVDALTEGVNLIAAEYRRRKAKEGAQKKAMVEAAGFAQLDKQCKASGLSKKAFVEGVGKTIIECNQPDDVKSRLMDTLGKYAKHLTEAQSVSGCIYSIHPLNETDKEFLANKDVEGLKKTLMGEASHEWGDNATATRAAIEEISANGNGTLGNSPVSLIRKIIDTDHEKLYLVKTTSENPGIPYIMHYEDTTKAV